MNRFVLMLFLFFVVIQAKEIEKILITPPKNFNINKIKDKFLEKYSFWGKNLNLKPFYISKYETTKKQYKEFLLKTNQKNKLEFFIDEEDEPVVNVTFDEAEKFCKYHKGRLPKEIEWIVSAGFKVAPSKCYENLQKNKFYPYAIAEFPLNPKGDIAICMQKQDEEFEADLIGSELSDVEDSIENINGTYGMFGNVWEWVDDEKIYFNQKYKIIKGGSFANYKEGKLFDSRISNFIKRDTKRVNIGFRCVWDIEK